jgi:hypothetical protein
MRSKKSLVIAAGAMLSMGVIAVSSPGRRALVKIVSVIAPASVTQSNQDVEQRAKARHGWGPAITNSVVRGSIIYYDPNGMPVRVAGVTIYRKHPDRLRVELARGGAVEVRGFDGSGAWKAGTAAISEEEGRDVRALLRVFPERLFVTRGGGARYREAGQRIDEDTVEETGPIAASPSGQQGQTRLKVTEQVEMEDEVGPRGEQGRAGDRRLVYYSISREDATVEAVQWLEPQDPRREVEDRSAALIDARAEFGDWRRVEGALLPYRIRHQWGGKVDYEIRVSEVLLNQEMPDTIFQNPNR